MTKINNICNNLWEIEEYIPKWVNKTDINLDQFFTSENTANSCLESLIQQLNKDSKKVDDYIFIEPSAGMGSFYDILPLDKKIGIDVDKIRDEYIHIDFLSWKPEPNNKYITIGNPPFGNRSWLALSFINHAAKFSDYVAFILPAGFQSIGKGSLQNRVNEVNLVYSEILSQEKFVDKSGNTRKINCVWQIWSKEKIDTVIKKTCNEYIELFTISNTKDRICGFNKLEKADYLLQRSYFGECTPKLVKTFNEVKYGCGYGIIIHKNKKEITEILNNANWNRYSNLSSTHCRHISMYHIQNCLIDNGFVDQEK
jgi:hypothetical protein